MTTQWDSQEKNTHLNQSQKTNQGTSLPKEKAIPAIIVGIGTMGYAIIRSLSSLNIPIIGICYDRKDIGFVSKWVTQSYLAPNPFVNEEQFIQRTIELSKSIGKGLLIPASDASLMALSHHKKELEKKYIVACPEWDITKLLMEKKETYLLAESVSVPVARMITPISVSDLEKHVKEIKFPCLIKPSLSHIFYRDFGTKVIKVKNFDELLLIYKKVNALGHEVMIQEYIPGDATCGVNYNSYFWDNEPLVEFTAKQIRNAPPDFGSPCVVKSHSFPEILELGRTVLKAMGFYGYSCIEFKKDIRDSSYKLMDVNGRHNLSSLLSVQCDLNFPALQYRHLVFGERPTGQDFQQDIYWIDLTRDIYYHALKSSVSFKEFLKPYLSKHVFAILNSKDLRPFSKRCIVQIKDYLTKTK